MEWVWSAPGISMLWIVLHSADYLLTVATARTYVRGDLRSRVDIGGGSLELNPVFQRAVDRGAWLSRRFLVTLVAGAVALFAVFTALGTLEALPGAALGLLPAAGEALAGVLVVTRAVVICGHLQNLALFRRILRNPAAACVSIRYDRGTIFAARRWSYAQPAALCAVAFLIVPRPFFAGGAAGMVLLALTTIVWQRIEPRRGTAAQPAPGPPGVAPPGPAATSRGSFPAT